MFRLEEGAYVQQVPGQFGCWSEVLQAFLEPDGILIRLRSRDGQPILRATERADQATERADQATERADQATERAEKAEEALAKAMADQEALLAEVRRLKGE